jgi:hypothetical protein
MSFKMIRNGRRNATRMKYYIHMMVLLFLIATSSESLCADSGTLGNKEPYQLRLPGTIQIPPPPEYKPMPLQPSPPTAPTEPEHKGALNPKTREFYPSVKEGVYNPKTGEYYPPISGGYFNPRTGEFYPSQDSSGSRKNGE